MHSVSDLTTSARKTTGDVPPKLVGASTTVVGDKMYLFGGRLVTERRMVADLYVFDLETFVWSKLPPHPEDDVPGARYFHSTDAWNHHLVVFGGMGHRPEATTADDLCVLNDVRFFDLTTKRWLSDDPNFARLAAAAAAATRTTGDPIASSSTDAALENASEPHLSAVSPTTPADLLNSLSSGADASSSSITTSSGGAPPAYNSNVQIQGQGTGHAFIPRARYAHLSSVTADRLVIVGGQDLNNVWLDDVCVYDLRSRQWAARRPYPRHAGTYRSVAVAANLRVRFPKEEAQVQAGRGDAGSLGLLGPPGGRYRVDKRPPSNAGRAEYTASENLVHLPYSTEPTDDFPNDIYLYSNYNFTDVKRELEVFQPLPGQACDFTLSDRSSQMTGQALPPGLRFPTGAICGTHLIFAGTYLAHSFQSYSIWALDLVSMTWSRLDPGAALATGSWFRAALWNNPGWGSSSLGAPNAVPNGNGKTASQGPSAKLLIFGNRQGNLVEDYNRRLLSWDDVAVVDLEAFGIYQPPRPVLDIKSQELGLAALEEGLMADFELVCDDGRKIGCSRKLLENRWPWFREQRKLFLDAAARALESIPGVEGDVPLPPDPTAEIRQKKGDGNGNGNVSGSESDEPRPDPRLTPRSLMLSEPYPITMALLQYFYSLSLLTPLQHAPAVLSQLMLLSATYNLPHLQSLVKHAMHRALTPATSVGVYEVATLCSCQSLQIRALKSVMASSKRAASGRNRGNSTSQGGGPGGGSNDGNNGPGGHSARPRGLSDLRGISRPDGSAVGNMGIGNGHGTDGHSNGSRYHGTGRADPNAAWQEWIPSSLTSSASAHPRSSVARAAKHSINLSLDSLYQALNSADEEYSDADPYYSTAGSTWDEQDGNGTGTESDVNNSPLLPSPGSAAVVFPAMRRVGSNPALSKVSSSTSLASSTGGSSTNRSASPQNLPPGRLTRNHYIGQSTLSPTAMQYPARLGIPRTRTSDSDLSGTASTTSTTSSSRGGLSPLSPETPPLPTPVDPFGSAQAQYFSKNTVSLTAIEEASLYDDDTTSGTRAQTPNGNPIQVHRPDDDFVTRKESLRAASTYVNPPLSPEPASPAASLFTTGTKKSSETVSETRQTSFTKSLFSRQSTKLRSTRSAESKASGLTSPSTISSGSGENPSMWSDSRDVRKAAKAEEKRRKKEEERKRIEQLAIQLKATRPGAPKQGPKDGHSTISGSSEERRRQANKWLEETDGLYGGAINTWGGL